VEPVGQWWAAGDKERWPPKGDPQRAEIEAAWQEPFGDRVNEVVFIGQALDRAAIERAFETSLLTDAELAAGMADWHSLADPFPEWEREEA
jgi:G3E family GTPase